MSSTVDYSVKQLFFDQKKVLNAINRAERRTLSRIGSFLRRRSRSSLRRRKRVSEPGKPPSVHSRDKVANLKNILFAYEPRRRSVVVGPVKLNQVNLTATGSKTVPELMEFGGTVGIREERFNWSDQWYRRDNRLSVRAGKQYRIRMARYDPRPFMQPSLEKEIQAGTIAEAWQSSVRAA